MKILIAGDFCPKVYMTSEILQDKQIQKTKPAYAGEQEG